MIGRGEHNDFKIPDGSVSTSHCEFFVEGGAVKLKDLGSTNGTHVDSRLVTEADLQPGQRIRLGKIELLFEMDTPQPQVVQLAPKIEGAVITLVAPPPQPQPEPMTAPIAAAPRLQISRAHALAIEPEPAPVLEAPPAPAQLSAPPAASSAQAISVGAVACKFHPKAAAQFTCNKCKKYFCAVCVMTRGVGPGAQHLCRTCGVDCVPVKSSFVSNKAERAKVYSDGQVLARCLGFGFGAALFITLLWGGFAWLTKFDVVFLFAIAAGGACGFAVKLGSQDRPGAIFSAIAISLTLLAIVLGKVAASFFEVALWSGVNKFITDVIGIVVGVFLAWWLSGGDL